MRRSWICGAALLAAAALGCGDDAEGGGRGPGPAGSNKPKAAGKKGKAAKKGDDGQGSKVATVSFTDDDFVESEGNRDPFRSFAGTFVAQVPAAPQRLVLMPDVAVNQMRLIAIVTGADKPRAMLVDPKGVGHVASRGDFIGRPEVVQTGGRESLPVTLNWRVDRIRSSEVVLAREDPSSPNRVPLTLVLSLHEQEGLGTGIEGGSSGDDVPEFDEKSTGG